MAETKVIFKNSPPQSKHDIDKEMNAQRLSRVKSIEDLIKRHKKFSGEEVSVTFMQQGVASLVSLLETSSDKIILKIHLVTGRNDYEADFLRKWESVGAKVPKVFGNGIEDGYSYVLMEYVDAPNIPSAYPFDEIVKNDVFKEIGQSLRTMHKARHQGFGWPNKPLFSTLGKLLENERQSDRFSEVRDIFDENYGTLENAFDVLQQKIGNATEGSYCHNDLDVGNVLATKPVTVFDPHPYFAHHFLDFGFTIIAAIARYSEFIVAEHLKKGYFGNDSFDEQLLHAGMIIASAARFRRWRKLTDTKKLDRALRYLKFSKKF